MNGDRSAASFAQSSGSGPYVTTADSAQGYYYNPVQMMAQQPQQQQQQPPRGMQDPQQQPQALNQPTQAAQPLAQVPSPSSLFRFSAGQMHSESFPCGESRSDRGPNGVDRSPSEIPSSTSGYENASKVFKKPVMSAGTDGQKQKKNNQKNRNGQQVQTGGAPNSRNKKSSPSICDIGRKQEGTNDPERGPQIKGGRPGYRPSICPENQDLGLIAGPSSSHEPMYGNGSLHNRPSVRSASYHVEHGPNKAGMRPSVSLLCQENPDFDLKVSRKMPAYKEFKRPAPRSCLPNGSAGAPSQISSNSAEEGRLVMPYDSREASTSSALGNSQLGSYIPDRHQPMGSCFMASRSQEPAGTGPQAGTLPASMNPRQPLTSPFNSAMSSETREPMVTSYSSLLTSRLSVGAVSSPALARALSTLSQDKNRRPRSEKKPIPDDQKDDKYFERRRRNNEAAKKSRDARKSREDELAIRASFLEKDNSVLKVQVMSMREEAMKLRQMWFQKCQSGGLNGNRPGGMGPPPPGGRTS